MTGGLIQTLDMEKKQEYHDAISQIAIPEGASHTNELDHGYWERLGAAFQKLTPNPFPEVSVKQFIIMVRIRLEKELACGPAEKWPGRDPRDALSIWFQNAFARNVRRARSNGINPAPKSNQEAAWDRIYSLIIQKAAARAAQLFANWEGKTDPTDILNPDWADHLAMLVKRTMESDLVDDQMDAPSPDWVASLGDNPQKLANAKDAWFDRNPDHVLRAYKRIYRLSPQCLQLLNRATDAGYVVRRVAEGNDVFLVLEVRSTSGPNKHCGKVLFSSCDSSNLRVHLKCTLNELRNLLAAVDIIEEASDDSVTSQTFLAGDRLHPEATKISEPSLRL